MEVNRYQPIFRHVYLRPGLQYIINPSANRNWDGNVRYRCRTAHSLMIFLSQIQDFVQQAHLVCTPARRQDVDLSAHGDPQQAYGRALRNGSVEQLGWQCRDSIRAPDTLGRCKCSGHCGEIG